MKFRISMKTPEALDRAVREAARELAGEPPTHGEGFIASHYYKDNLEEHVDDLKELAKTWFEFGEYLTVEVDTEAKTCVVIPRKG